MVNTRIQASINRRKQAQFNQRCDEWLSAIVVILGIAAITFTLGLVYIEVAIGLIK